MRKVNKIISSLLLVVCGFFIASMINVRAATQVVAAYTGTTTTNMAKNENNAALIGLDPTIFNVITNKGSSNNEVGLNKDGTIRLYYSTGENKGTSMEIKVLEGYIIQAISYSIKASYSPDANIIVDNGEPVLYSGYTTGIQLDNIGASSVIIHNVNDTNVQMHISQIEITYTSIPIKSLPGASIRTEGNQGLRFDAEVLDGTNIQEKGFYLLKGEATIADLMESLATMLYNGKTVFKQAVPGVAPDGRFSIVLTGIPIKGYLDDITVIPYVVKTDSEVVYSNPIVRSVGQVAINMAQAGAPLPQGVQDVLNTINNNFTRVGIIGENLEIAKGLKDADNNYVNSSLYTIYNPDVTEIILPEPAPKPSQNFLGWYANPELTGEAITSVQTANITAITTLYPKWELDLPTILEVRALSLGTATAFEGIVTGIDGNNIFVQDNTAAIYLYNANKPADLAVGDKVYVEGNRDVYKGLQQITNATVTIQSSGNTLPAILTVTDITSLTEAHQTQRITISDLTVKSKSGSNLVLTDGTNDITLYESGPSAVYNHIQTAIVGQSVIIHEGFVGWYNGLQLKVNDVLSLEFVEISDELKVALAKEALTLPEIATADGITLPTVGLHETNIDWTSSNNAVIDIDGTVTPPTGEAVVVTLTATISIGDASDTKEFLVTVNPGSATEQEIAYEDFESYTSTNSYTVDPLTAGDYTIVYGNTVSTASPVYGSMHVLIRVAKNTSNVGSITYKTSETPITKVSFQARYTHSSVVVTVQFSNDGGATWGEAVGVEGLTTTYSTVPFEIASNVTNANTFRILVTTSKVQTSHRDLLLDDIRVYGMV